MKTGETPINVNVVQVDLSEIEAKRFLEFQKYYDVFSVMCKAGVFEIKNGQAILNFDSEGTLNDIDFNIKAYKRGKRIIAIIQPIAQ
jgi:hypothetical protein